MAMSEGDLVFEPFNGSGTSLLAAQRTRRRCRAVEIAPEYVDVAIRRFQQNHAVVAITLAVAVPGLAGRVAGAGWPVQPARAMATNTAK